MPVGDLTERRLTHYVGGAWHAPLSDRLIPATGGMIVAAGHDDALRAFRLTRPGPAPALPDIATLWPAIAAAARAEGAAEADFPLDVAPVGTGGRALILPGPDVPVAAMVVGTLSALAAGAGVVLLPQPSRAQSAMALTIALHAASLPAGRFALLQGDAASAAALSALPFDQILRCDGVG